MAILGPTPYMSVKTVINNTRKQGEGERGKEKKRYFGHRSQQIIESYQQCRSKPFIEAQDALFLDNGLQSMTNTSVIEHLCLQSLKQIKLQQEYNHFS